MEMINNYRPVSTNVSIKQTFDRCEYDSGGATNVKLINWDDWEWRLVRTWTLNRAAGNAYAKDLERPRSTPLRFEFLPVVMNESTDHVVRGATFNRWELSLTSSASGCHFMVASKSCDECQRSTAYDSLVAPDVCVPRIVHHLRHTCTAHTIILGARRSKPQSWLLACGARQTSNFESSSVH